MSFLVTETWLKKEMKKDRDDNLVIIDVRFDLNDPQFGRQAYLKDHILGAHFLDIDSDLSGEVGDHGGNHPLPEVSLLAKKLGNIGVNHETTVVIYDSANDMFAPRAWWLLHYMGHKKAYVLDGGYQAWIESENDITKDIPLSKPKKFTPQVNSQLVVDMNDVKVKISDKTALLIDSRARERYLGINEPLYKKAGHIPGAKNYFWGNVLADDGKWKSKEALKRHFASLTKVDEIIVSCGSGVSACPNILALKMLGFENVKLYPGSYSDWISYPENEIKTGME